jgi:hypothetical protein
MTLWELGAAIDGWIDAHVPENKRAPSAAERDEMIEFMERQRNGD